MLHNRNFVHKLRFLNSQLIHFQQRVTCTKPAEAVFIERLLEEPVLVVAEHDCVDIIGPPDPLSNLRPIIRKRLARETVLQQKLRKLQEETQAWNQKFWATHNQCFLKERQEYVKQHLKPNENKETLTADEMSEFYKLFLDKYWATHVYYNFEWYKKNFTLLLLAFRVNLQQLIRS